MHFDVRVRNGFHMGAEYALNRTAYIKLIIPEFEGTHNVWRRIRYGIRAYPEAILKI